MELRIGRYYQTREGKQIFKLLQNLECGDFPWIAQPVFPATGVLRNYSNTGKYPTGKSDHDLVCEVSWEYDEKHGAYYTPLQAVNQSEDLYPESREAIEKRFTSQTYHEFVKVTLDALQALIKAKQADYTNGKGPFANFEQASDYGVDPFKGLMVRMGDKMQRVKSYCSQGGLQVPNEGVEDSLKDIIGYSLIGLGMLEETKRSKK